MKSKCYMCGADGAKKWYVDGEPLGGLACKSCNDACFDEAVKLLRAKLLAEAAAKGVAGSDTGSDTGTVIKGGNA
jgi:hypothetical protein